MSLTSALIGVAERVPLPDLVVRTAIERVCARTAAELSRKGMGAPADFAGATACRGIDEYTAKASLQAAGGLLFSTEANQRTNRVIQPRENRVAFKGMDERMEQRA